MMFAQVLPEVTPALFGLVFIEGLLAFLSPCILPLLPVYLMYLAGSDAEKVDRRRLLTNVLGFVLGFTVVFVLLGATASTVGSLLVEYRQLLIRVSGVVVILFGLNYLEVIRIGFLNRSSGVQAKTSDLGFVSSLVFGGAFSAAWTPCLGAFLGTALLLASHTQTLWAGMALLFMFGIGLAVPFILTALLWHQLQGVLGFVKQNLKYIQRISGGLLVLIGILMLTGHLQILFGMFS